MKDLLQKAGRARDAGNLVEAAKLYADILRAEPRNFEALLSLGFVHFRAGHLEDAEHLCGEAARLNPRSADAFFMRGCVLQRLDRNAEALECFNSAIALRSGFVEALINRGALLTSAQRHAEALKNFDTALAINPQMVEAWNNRGNVLSELGRHQEAVASYDKVLTLRPGFVEALINRGTALIALHRLHEALASYDQAAQLSPERADALAGCANALFEAKEYERAATLYAATLARDSDYPYASGNLAFSRLHCCDWRSLDTDRTVIARQLLEGRRAINPFQAIALLESPSDLKRCATLWVADKYPSSAASRARKERNADHTKIRVAYLSADFNGHAVATLLAGVFEQHDKARFETTAVSYTDSDGRAMRRRLERSFDRGVDVAGKTDAEVATLIRQMDIDIAVDLMGYTGECRPGIFALRPAPAQVNFLGFPGTTGASYIDYIIADPIVIPEEDKPHYSESIVYLPDTYLSTDSTRAIAAQKPTRIQAGLPEHSFVFCSFNNSYKFTPEMFDVWMRLLSCVEGSVLWLSQTNAAAVRNLRAEAAQRGVADERLVFAPFLRDGDDHLARLGLADLFLDTLPYNAHSTAVDALWAGVPLLTSRGAAFAGRVAASALTAAGLPELIVSSLDAYEALALKLAREPQTLAALRTKLERARGMSSLFDTTRYTRNLEAAYLTMWERSRA